MEGVNYKPYSIPDAGIKFEYPAWWQHSIEMGKTSLFCDEQAGTFRITPFFGVYDEEHFLQNKFDVYKKNGMNPALKTFNNQVYLYNEEDFEIDNTRYHYYMTTAPKLIVICSFYYDKNLLENEKSKNKVLSAIREVEHLLSGLTIGN